MIGLEPQPDRTLALLSWWRDAGVDLIAQEQPVAWLALQPNSPAAPVANGQTAQAVDVAPQAQVPIPDSYAELINWLKNDPSLPDGGPPERRLVASGQVNSQLMIVMDCPEANDHEAGSLLSGASGALFDAMLAALGTSRDAVYIAPLCPGRPATGQISKSALPRLTEIMRHHIALVVPKRLWLLGSTVSRAILGTDDVASAGNLRDFNHATVKIPTVASFAPRFLLEHPQQKARVWADMQALIKGL